MTARIKNSLKTVFLMSLTCELGGFFKLLTFSILDNLTQFLLKFRQAGLSLEVLVTRIQIALTGLMTLVVASKVEILP